MTPGTLLQDKFSVADRSQFRIGHEQFLFVRLSNDPLGLFCPLNRFWPGFDRGGEYILRHCVYQTLKHFMKI